MENKKDLKCKSCGSGDIYTKIDGAKVCRKCGYREAKHKNGR